jgi:enoyl-CoA hydratase/carnithine racemase
VRGGTDDSFIAGADISEFGSQRSTVEQVTRYHEDYVRPCLEALLTCETPIVAMIGGPCMGGGLEIAAACDLRIAGASSTFGAPVARMGFPLAFGETELLVRTFGRPTVAELLLAGRIFDAAEAKEAGLLHRVVAQVDLADEVMRTAGDVAKGSPLAARSHKRQLLRLLRDPAPVSAAERAQVYGFADWNDYRIGYQAFVSRDKPFFTGT